MCLNFKLILYSFDENVFFYIHCNFQYQVNIIHKIIVPIISLHFKLIQYSFYENVLFYIKNNLLFPV